MAAPNNPLVARVAIIGARDTRQIVNTFHMARSTPWDLASMATLAADVKTWIDTYYKFWVPGTYTFNQISVRSYDPAAPLAYDLSISPVLTGNRAGTAEAGNVTLTMSLRTGLAGRKFRGRMYTFGLSESDVNNNDTATSALVAGLATVAQQFLTAMIVSGRGPVVWHKATNTFTTIIGYAIENIIDSQRRRLPGRGR